VNADLPKGGEQCDYRVHSFRIKNVALSADEHLIEQARLIARSQHATLNEAFCDWLAQYAAQSESGEEFEALMKRLRHVNAGRTCSRDEMNE